MIEAFLIYFCAICAFPIKRLWTHYEVAAFLLPMLFSTVWLVILRLKNGQPLVPKLLVKMPVCWFLSLYSFFCILSCFRAADLRSAIIETAYRLVILWLFIYMYACGSRKPIRVIHALSVFSIVAFVYAAITAWYGFRLGFGPAVGAELYSHKNDLGDVCASLFVIAFAFLMYSKKKPLTYFLAGVIPLTITAMVATQSKGALLSAIVASLLMLVARQARPRYFIAWLIVVPAMLVSIAISMPKEAAERASSPKVGTSLYFRALYWDLVRQHIAKHPIQSIGIAQPLKVNGIEVRNYCNWVLQDYVELGPLGAIASILFALSAIWLPLSNRRLVAGTASVAAINTAALGLIASRFAHGAVDTFWDYSIRNLIAFEAIGIAIFVQLWIAHRISRSSEISLH